MSALPKQEPSLPVRVVGRGELRQPDDHRAHTVRVLRTLQERGVVLQRVYERAGVNPSRVTAQVSRGGRLNESDDMAIRRALTEMIDEFGEIVAELHQ